MGKPASRRRAYASAGVPRTVLHIRQSDALGGSGRSAYRLHSTLRKHGMTLADARRAAAHDRPGRPPAQAQHRLARRRPDRGDDRRLVRPPVRLLPVVLRRRVGPVVPRRRRRAALQHARLVLQPHRAAVSLAASPGRLAAERHVGVHRARRVLVRLRALAARLRLVPVPRRVPRALARHDRRALALEERGLQAIEADDRRAFALDRAARVGEPAALALPDRAHPERHRPRALPPRRRARRRARGSGCRRRARSCCSAHRTSPTGARAARS